MPVLCQKVQPQKNKPTNYFTNTVHAVYGSPRMTKQAPIISAKNLTKRYDDAKSKSSVLAVDNISFNITAGEFVGLLGPNGAGKSSTMKMLLGQAQISGGELTALGGDVRQLSRAQKMRIGLVSQEDNLDPDLTVLQNLIVYASYYGIGKKDATARAHELLSMMKISEKANAKVQQLSGGMKRRLTIARALVANPDILALDEPTTGLDPQARVLIWQRLTDLKKAGKTIILTTHYMDEAERLCDRIILIDHGKILDEGTPASLIKKHVKKHVIEVAKPLPKALAEADIQHEDLGDSVLFFTDTASKVAKLIPTGHKHFQRPATLEDVFLNLTGRALRE